MAAGDAAALALLMRAYWPLLVVYADRVLNQRDAAEDIAQESFVRLWQGRVSWRSEGSVRAFLYRVARNLALNERRRAQVRVNAAPLLSESQRDPVHLADALEEDDLSAAVERAIARLPERRRQIFCLARFHGMSYAEIAVVMQLSPQTVANQMSAAMADLRDLLSPLLTSSPCSH